MSKAKDLTGQKFGRLTVIERDMSSKSAHVKWICRCDCGNIKSISGNHLRRGYTTSCGCARKGVNLKDITGQKFGRLVTLERTKKRLDIPMFTNAVATVGTYVMLIAHP